MLHNYIFTFCFVLLWKLVSLTSKEEDTDGRLLRTRGTINIWA